MRKIGTSYNMTLNALQFYTTRCDENARPSLFPLTTSLSLSLSAFSHDNDLSDVRSKCSTHETSTLSSFRYRRTHVIQSPLSSVVLVVDSNPSWDVDVTSCVRELISHVAFLCTSPGPGPNMLLSPSYFSTNSPRGYDNFLFVPVLETVHTVNAPSPKNVFVASSVVVSQTCTYVAVERFPSISCASRYSNTFSFLDASRCHRPRKDLCASDKARIFKRFFSSEYSCADQEAEEQRKVVFLSMRGCRRLWVVNTSDDDEATDDMFAFYSIDNGAFSETVTLFFPSVVRIYF